MSEKIKVTKAELEELIDGGVEVGPREHWRHGSRVMFKVEKDGVPYLTQYLDMHGEEGLQIWGDDNELTRAEQVEVMTKVWREVP